jgi:tetratricopeptide (TPR) repeat protein
MHQQNAADNLLAFACIDLKKGDVYSAVAFFEGLSKNHDYFLRGDAIIGLASAVGRLPSKDSLNAKRETLEGLLEDKQICKDGTVTRADALTMLAQTYTGLRQYDTAGKLLDGATAIYFELGGNHVKRAVAIYMQAAVLAAKGQFDEALTKINRSKTIGAIDVPWHIPENWLRGESPVEREIENKVAALATSMS